MAAGICLIFAWGGFWEIGSGFSFLLSEILHFEKKFNIFVLQAGIFCINIEYTFLEDLVDKYRLIED